MAKINSSAIAWRGSANSSSILTGLRVNLFALRLQVQTLHSGVVNSLPLLCSIFVGCGFFIGDKLCIKYLVAQREYCLAGKGEKGRKPVKEP